MKTKEEVENLKADWVKDPCYDLEETKGFEEYREELFDFAEKQEIKVGDINSYLLHKIGFSSGFTSDPQEPNPSKKFWLGQFELFMPNSTLYDYYYNDNGNMVRVETIKQLSDLYLSKTGNDLKINP